MLEGWTIASSYGSMRIRSARISARMSRSERSTAAPYPLACRPPGAAHRSAGDGRLTAFTRTVNTLI